MAISTHIRVLAVLSVTVGIVIGRRYIIQENMHVCRYCSSPFSKLRWPCNCGHVLDRNITCNKAVGCC